MSLPTTATPRPTNRRTGPAGNGAGTTAVPLGPANSALAATGEGAFIEAV
jgi:hypothetical protein